MAAAVVHRISVYPLAIPFRRGMMSLASQQVVAEPVVVGIELTNGTIGYGEAVTRSDVAQETVVSITDTVREVFVPSLIDFHPDSFPGALEAIEALPWHDAAHRQIPAARGAVELALMDASMRVFRRDIDDVVQWMGLPGFGSPGSTRQVRFTGVLAAGERERGLRRLRRMYWRGLRAFKLQVGMEGDRDQFNLVAAYLRRPIAKGRASLRVDARGCWSKDEAIEWLSGAASLPIAAVEQPLARGKEEQLPILRDLFDIPIVHDESLVTVKDAQRLVELGVAEGFNIRVSKCGGLIPALRLAGLARRSDIRIEVGSAPGGTSLLSAATLRFLQVCPAVVWAEECCGKSALMSDIVAKRPRFGYPGRSRGLPAGGLGVEVDLNRLRSSCISGPVTVNL